MFKVTCYVNDKDLGETFKRLAGIGKNIEHVYMPNIEGRPNGKLKVNAEDSLEALTKEIHKRHLTEITAPVMKDMVSKLGYSPTSYSHFLAGLKSAGVLKKLPKVKGQPAVRWEVLGK